MKIIHKMSDKSCDYCGSLMRADGICPTCEPHAVCDNCRRKVPETYYVKFPAVDYNQEQEFCKHCTDKFSKWRNGEISIHDVFDKSK